MNYFAWTLSSCPRCARGKEGKRRGRLRTEGTRLAVYQRARASPTDGTSLTSQRHREQQHSPRVSRCAKDLSASRREGPRKGVWGQTARLVLVLLYLRYPLSIYPSHMVPPRVCVYSFPPSPACISRRLSLLSSRTAHFSVRVAGGLSLSL